MEVTKSVLLDAYNKKQETYNAWYAKFQTYSQDTGTVKNETLLNELAEMVQAFNEASNEYDNLRAQWISEHSGNEISSEETEYEIDSGKLLYNQPKTYAKNPFIDDVKFIPDSCKTIDDILNDKSIDWDKLTEDIESKNDVKSLKEKLGFKEDEYGNTSVTKEQFQTICNISGLTEKFGLTVDEMEKLQKGIDIEVDITSDYLKKGKEDIQKQYKKVSDAMGDFNLEIPKPPSLPTLPGPTALVTVITMALKKAEVELKKSLAEKAKKMAMDAINKKIPKNTDEALKKANDFKNDASGKKTGFDVFKEKMLANVAAKDPSSMKSMLENKLKEEQGKIGSNNKDKINELKNQLDSVNQKIDTARKTNEALKKIEQEKLDEALNNSNHDKAKEYQEYLDAKKKYQKSNDFLLDKNMYHEWQEGIKS